MRKKIVAGNWKMNMNLQDGIALAKELNETQLWCCNMYSIHSLGKHCSVLESGRYWSGS